MTADLITVLLQANPVRHEMRRMKPGGEVAASAMSQYIAPYKESSDGHQAWWSS